ncbi:glycoside hydrolase family 32 protein [Oceanobacillus polygoni]|uniref:Levanase/fructan beta-fructosidase n=1 Tax=Oceanobacillus polygoni TaxID=1235259 RepID=A0A9X0YNS2_9BACI|nr:glycoside hydrolase family 32 protein [Oceanobacillus polygoni]MBP2075963.1 levanase/fructan beta-fructosidase [Oceanobacillus polygoni]
MTNQELQRYRPNLHFAAKKNWLNDPNGLVYFKGEYHLFFQYNPHDSVWGSMHWGHAVSKDLITWEELDIALYPDEHGTIFSGSAVVDWNNTTGFFPNEPGLVAIFTHHKDGNGETPPKQSQSLAYSSDNGRTWFKYEGNPVLSHKTKVDFRDPKVFWNMKTSKWIMSLATGQTITFYSSPNLIDWQFESEFGENVGSHDGVWECPDLFKLKVEGTGEEKWVLLVSIGDNGISETGSCTQYFIGDFDGSVFRAEHDDIRWLDHGRDNYAGVSFSDIPEEDGRRIYLGWMSNWRYANEVPTEGWRNQMTIPRMLQIRKIEGKYIVIQYPVAELDTYFERSGDIHGLEINNSETKVFEVNEPYLELFMNILNSDADQFGITLNHTQTQSTTIEYDASNDVITLNREKSGKVEFSEMFSLEKRLKMDNSKNVQLRVIVDTFSIEVFVNDGAYAITSLVYPDQTCETVAIYSQNGKITVENGCIATPNKTLTI